MIANNAISTLDRLSMQLIELENVLYRIALNLNIPNGRVDTLENHIRGLRDLSNSLWATEIVETGMTFKDLGIQAFNGNGYIEIQLPYDLVSKSTLFMLTSKRLSTISSLTSLSTSWHYLIRQIVNAYGSMPFVTPLQHAVVDITVLVPDRRKRDPDHFFYRPIQDGLVRNRVLVDDTVDNVDIAFHYSVDRENPGVVVQVRPAGTKKLPIRSSLLRPVVAI